MVEYDLKDVATVSGKPGLYKIVKPTRNGVIIETMDEHNRRMMIQTRHKISLLHEISIFTTDEEGSVPLETVFAAMHENYGTELNVDSESEEAELRDFIEEVCPDFDPERVYTSDIKKLISWFGIVNEHKPPTEKKEEKKAKKEKPAAKKETKAKTTPKKKAAPKKEKAAAKKSE